MKRFVSLLASLILALVVSQALAQPKPAASKSAPAVVDSLTLLERAVAKDSTKFDNLYKLGVMYMDRERMPEAARVLSRAERIKPQDVKVLVNLGVVSDAQGHAPEAQGYYQRALQVAPSDSVAMCRLASSYYAVGQYDKAMTQLRELIRTKPRSHCAYFTMGVAFADAGIYRDAIRMWRKVVELAPESPEALSAKESIDVLEKFIGQAQQPGAHQH